MELLATHDQADPEDPAARVIRNEVDKRLRSRPIGEALLAALAAEPTNAGRRLQAQVEVDALLTADPRLAEWAQRHLPTRQPVPTGARPATRNRRTTLIFGVLGVLLVVITTIVVLATSGSDTLTGEWREIGDALSSNGEILVHSPGDSRSVLNPLTVYEDDQLSTEFCAGTATLISDARWRLTFDCGRFRPTCEATFMDNVTVARYDDNQPIILGTVDQALQLRCPDRKRLFFVRPNDQETLRR